jgi:predicted dinucleotide-binding enzyme
MKIGIIGSGNVGGALGRRWAAAGHEILFSSRNPSSGAMQAVVAEAGPTARAASPGEAAAEGEIVLLATPWNATRDAIRGAGSLEGKVLIDATNPLLPNLAGLEMGTTTSGGEQVAGWAPGARVVKAFNTIGANIMADPGFGDSRPVLFYCGDDKAAKQKVHQLAAEIGFDAHDAGPLRQARLLEPFALLWISLALEHGYGREIAFRFLRR